MESRVPDGGGPAATAAAPNGGPAAPAPARAPGGPPAWQSLPSIQRVTPDEPRLNLPDAFTGSLAAWRDPSYLAPLGHLVGAAEPAGVLHETAVPVAAPPPGAAEQPSGDGPAPLPLATPPVAGPRSTASPLQRHVADAAPARTPDAGPSDRPSAASPVLPSAGPPPQRPVPVEPVAVSRLVTAPPPPQELFLPTVADPTVDQTIGNGPAVGDPVIDGPIGAAPTADGPAGPTDDPEPAVTPTLGTGETATGTGAGDPVTPAPGSAGGDAAQGSAVGGTRAAPDLPVQRAPGESARPPRRLGLGEPIVSPVSAAGPPWGTSPPPVQRARVGEAAVQPAPPSPGGDSPAFPVQRSLGGDTGPAARGRGDADRPAGGRGDAGEAAGGAGPVETGTAPDDRSAPLVGDGEITVSRLDAGVSPTGEGSPLAGPPGAGTTGGDARPAGDPAPPAGLPVAGPTPAPSARGGPADAGTGTPPPARTADTGTPPPIQTYVPPTGAELAPLLGRPSASSPADTGDSTPGATQADTGTGTPWSMPTEAGSRTVEPTPAGAGGGPPGSGAGLPVVSRLAASAAPPTAAPAGAQSPPGGGPLVVARLVGDRPTPLLTGATPAAPAPEQPRVQRVTWQRDEPSGPAEATRIAATGDGTAGDGTAGDGTTGNAGTAPLTVVAAVDGHAPAVAPSAAPAPDALALATTGSPPRQAGGGLPPVQRWVGALPGTPSQEGRTGSPLPAYPWTGPVVQRAEPVDAAAFPADPPVADPPPADPPPADPPAGAATGGQAGAGAAAGAPGGGAVEPEELLKKLYDPLLRRLKTELRLDRERHGVLGGPG